MKEPVLTIVGKHRVRFPNLPDGGRVTEIGGTLADEYVRLTEFMHDLFVARAWTESAAIAENNLIREGLMSAALLRFCRCFEGTSGVRTKPLSVRKIFSPPDRMLVKSLREARNKFVAHDDQTHPMTKPIVILDATGTAIDVMLAKGLADFQNFGTSAELLRLVNVALDYVRAAHVDAGQAIQNEINSVDTEVRLASVPGAREITITVTQDLKGGPLPDPASFSADVTYIIPDHLLPR